VVAFLDILGFKELMRDAYTHGQSHQFLEKVRRALREARRHLDDKRERAVNGEAFWRVKVFTDNIVLGIPVTDNAQMGLGLDTEMGLGLALSLVGWYQYRLVQQGFFVRGGIAAGDFYMDQDVVFGEALLEAYDAESRLARDPRIVLAQSAVRCVQEHLCSYATIKDAPHEQEVLVDVDDQHFINYLMVALDGAPPNPAYFADLINHREVIEVDLRRFRREPRYWSKYAWAANYHNFVCADLRLDPGEYGIHAVHLQPHPRKLHMAYKKKPGCLIRRDSGTEVARRPDLGKLETDRGHSLG